MILWHESRMSFDDKKYYKMCSNQTNKYANLAKDQLDEPKLNLLNDYIRIGWYDE